MSASAKSRVVDGVQVRAQYFDDLLEACEVVREGCALFDLAWRSHLVVSGKHARRFLHNMTTCQVKELEAGDGRFGMSVNSSGKLVAEFFLDAEEERLIVESSHSGASAMSDHLQRHKVADRVDLDLESSRRVLGLIGAGSEAVLRFAVSENLELATSFAWCDVTIGSQPARVRRNDHRLGLPGWDVTVDADHLEDVRRALTSVGATPIGHDAFEICRVLAGVPEVPVDMGLDNVPLEASVLYETVDWEEGCYIGQEVIAMMHYRGRPNRHLRGLALAAASVGTGDTVSTPEGREVGKLGTVVTLPGEGATVALAVIQRKHAETGTRLMVSEVPAEVLELPLV